MPRILRSVLSPGAAGGLLLTALGWLVPLASASAQTGMVSGVITDSMSGRPLPDALIRAEGTNASSRSNLRHSHRCP